MKGFLQKLGACLATMACLCFVGLSLASPDNNQAPSELRVVSPDGQLTITLSATNERAGVFVHDARTGHYAAIYSEDREGATVSVGDLDSTAKNHAVHMAMNSKIPKLQIPKQSGEVPRN